MLKLHWYLPTGGDIRSLGDLGSTYAAAKGARTTGGGYRRATWDYLAQVARTADALGYEGMLTPTGFNSEEAWIATASLIPETRNLKFMVAFRPGLINPVLAAQTVTTYQRMSKNRLLLNLVPGATGPEAERYGDWLDKDERLAQAGEFIEVMRGSWGPEPFDYEGTYYRTKGTTIPAPAVEPTLYYGGSSEPSGRFAAKHVDVYLTFAEPLELVAEKLEWMRRLEREVDRPHAPLRFGMRGQVLSRDTSAEAWAAADRLLADVTDQQIADAQRALKTRGSVGQQRMRALADGSRDNVVVAPNLWAGASLIRGGIGTTFVGSHEEIADRLMEYMDLGISEIVLGGYPHIEEAHWFAEGVMPILRERGVLDEGHNAPALVGSAAGAPSDRSRR